MTAKTNPAKADALGEPIEFDFDGVTYTIEPAAQWDLDVVEAAEEGRYAVACKTLLGPAQWAKFRAKPRKVQDLGELFEAVQEAVGAGN